MTTPTFASKALLWVLSHYPFANAEINARMLALARALPKLSASDSTMRKADNYIDSAMGLGALDEHCAWREAFHYAVKTLGSNPPTGLREHIIVSCARAAKLTGPPEDTLSHYFFVRDFLEWYLP